MRRSVFLPAAVAAVAACGQTGESESTSNAAAKAAAVEKERPAYCFFKDSETRAWKARRDAQGNVVVTGKAYREDSRYQAVLGPPRLSGGSVEIAPTIVPNQTGFAAANNWWDVKAVIPGSRAVTTVKVTCGAGTLAMLEVPLRP